MILNMHRWVKIWPHSFESGRATLLARGDALLLPKVLVIIEKALPVSTGREWDTRAVPAVGEECVRVWCQLAPNKPEPCLGVDVPDLE